MQWYFTVVEALGNHLIWSLGSGYIQHSLCDNTMSNGIILVLLNMKPVLHFRHSVAFGASSRKHTINGLSLW